MSVQTFRKKGTLQKSIDSYLDNRGFEGFLNHFKSIETNEKINAVRSILPLFLVFFRSKVGKKRTKIINKYHKVKGKYKKAKTEDQNNFSVYVYYANNVNALGTIWRIVKHKGHGTLVCAYEPNQNEIERYINAERIVYRKYKNFNQLYLLRKVYEHHFFQLTETLDKIYKCTSTGQTKLF